MFCVQLLDNFWITVGPLLDHFWTTYYYYYYYYYCRGDRHRRQAAEGGPEQAGREAGDRSPQTHPCASKVLQH
eukprot:9838547-Heterocapsa_arctica.AAC.1